MRVEVEPAFVDGHALIAQRPVEPDGPEVRTHLAAFGERHLDVLRRIPQAPGEEGDDADRRDPADAAHVDADRASLFREHEAGGVQRFAYLGGDGEDHGIGGHSVHSGRGAAGQRARQR